MLAVGAECGDELTSGVDDAGVAREDAGGLFGKVGRKDVGLGGPEDGAGGAVPEFDVAGEELRGAGIDVTDAL